MIYLPHVVVFKKVQYTEACTCSLRSSSGSETSSLEVLLSCTSSALRNWLFLCSSLSFSFGCSFLLGLCRGLLLRSRFVGTNRPLLLLMLFHLFRIDRQLHEMVHLSFGALDVLLFYIWQFRKCLVSLLLEVKCFPIISQLVVSMCNCLVT